MGSNRDSSRLLCRLGLAFLLPGLMCIISAIVLYLQKAGLVSVQIVLTIGGSLTFIALVQLLLAYYLNKREIRDK